jgi:diguanylate cyclase (GGDEF)-like protein
MKHPEIPLPPDFMAGAATETSELLARSQRLEALLAHTSRNLKTLEEQLTSSEAIASFGHFKIDSQDRFLLSRSAQALLGVATQVAHLDQALLAASNADSDRIGDAIRHLSTTGEQVDEEIAVEIPQAGTRWLRIVVRSTKTGNTSELYGLIIDTTTARRDAVRRDIALKVSEALLQDVDSQAAYEWVLQSVCNGLGWDIGSCWLTDANGTRAKCLAAWSRPDQDLQALAGVMRGREVGLGEGMVGAVLAARAASWSEDVGSDTRFAERAAAASAGIHAAYTFPIVMDGTRCAGVLQFLSRRARQFDAQLPGISELIGALLAQRMRREVWIARLREVAERDALTGLWSRYALIERIGQAVAAAGRPAFSVCVFDLNRFRLVNDALGHEAGDLVLKTVAARVRQRLPAHAVLARLSGDEFAVLVPGGAQVRDLTIDDITASIAAPLLINGYEFSLTAGIGSASFPADGGDAETLLRDADNQRHRAKRHARGAPAGRADGHTQDSLAEMRTEHELRNAIEHGELVVHYQPIVRLGAPGMAGAEALIRWRHPQRGLLAPASFLSVAEEAGLTRAISRAVLSQVTRDLAAAPAAFAADFRVNINLSALDFRDLKLFKELGALLREAGMSPQRYRFEVTEGMLMEDVGTAERVVGLLADYGVEFAIDDFGTGYSSLAQLSRLPVHELKIDHTFTQSIDTRRGKTVVRAVLDLAARLEMPVTAEGIETRTQALALAAYGCDKGQGYLYGRAMPFDALLDFAAAYSTNGAVNGATTGDTGI